MANSINVLIVDKVGNCDYNQSEVVMVVACRYIDQWIDYLDKDIRELFHPHNGML